MTGALLAGSTGVRTYTLVHLSNGDLALPNRQLWHRLFRAATFAAEDPGRWERTKHMCL